MIPGKSEHDDQHDSHEFHLDHDSDQYQDHPGSDEEKEPSENDKVTKTISKNSHSPGKELSLHKDSEQFVFRYSPGSEEEVLDSFIAMANDRANNFDWFDAAVLSFQLSKNLVEEADKLLCPTMEQ